MAVKVLERHGATDELNSSGVLGTVYSVEALNELLLDAVTSVKGNDSVSNTTYYLLDERGNIVAVSGAEVCMYRRRGPW